MCATCETLVHTCGDIALKSLPVPKSLTANLVLGAGFLRSPMTHNFLTDLDFNEVSGKRQTVASCPGGFNRICPRGRPILLPPNSTARTIVPRMIDQRQNQRRYLALPVVAGGSVQCTLLDVSREGARLASSRRLPDQFYVMLKPDLKRWCQVLWRRRDQVGVKFIPDPKAPAQSKGSDVVTLT